MEAVAAEGGMGRAVDRAEARSGECMALPRTEFFIEPPPGYTAKKKTRRKRNRDHQGLLSVARQPLPPLSPFPPTPRAYCVAWGCVIRTYPPP